jgi:hypothetical protein
VDGNNGSEVVWFFYKHCPDGQEAEGIKKRLGRMRKVE